MSLKRDQEKPPQAPLNWNIPEISESADYVGSQENIAEVRDTVPIRGTQYLIRVPNNWNGTLISDLDYVALANSTRNRHLLKQGYALSGTERRSDRLNNYDPAREIHDIISVLDIFESLFGKPKRVIQIGCSGGGTITLSMAELHPDRIDGAITACAPTCPWMVNTHLDSLFVLKSANAFVEGSTMQVRTAEQGVFISKMDSNTRAVTERQELGSVNGNDVKSPCDCLVTEIHFQ